MNIDIDLEQEQEQQFYLFLKQNHLELSDFFKKVILDCVPKKNSLASAFYCLTQLPEDCFKEQRVDPFPEERETL